MTDALVIGGGPGGLASAIALRREGLRVTLLERLRPPVDKACGEGILPPGVEILTMLGIELPPSATASLRGIRFIDGEVEATAFFREGKGIGTDRTVLHDALARRAAEVGVDLRWGEPALGFHPDGVRTGSGRLRARWIVAADGERSAARRWLGIDAPASSRRFGLRRHYSRRPWSDLVEVHWSTRCEAYVTPVGPGRIGVAMLTDDPALRFDEALARFPSLRRNLEKAPASGPDLGAATVLRSAAAVTRGRYALLGDAAGSVDGISGEGITLALRQASALARSLRGGDLIPYARSVRRTLRVPRLMTSMMLGIDRRETLRHGAMRLLASSPKLFSSILDFHARGGARRVHDGETR